MLHHKSINTNIEDLEQLPRAQILPTMGLNIFILIDIFKTRIPTHQGTLKDYDDMRTVGRQLKVEKPISTANKNEKQQVPGIKRLPREK